jgi:Lysyl oxidase
MLARLLPVLVVIAFGAVVVVSWAGGPAEPPPAAQRLPDLDQELPGKLQITHDENRGLHRLGFSSAVRNVGAGPLIVSGRRRPGVPTMTADQVIEQEDGGLGLVEGVGRMRYVRSPDHAHWHLLGFERYELRRATGRARLVTDRKTGFCLGDRYQAKGVVLDALAPEPVYTGHCGLRRTGLRNITVGISVGYGDDYLPMLEGQSLLLTGLKSGRYRLIHRVNAGRRLRESNYANNESALLIRLRWRRGRPRIRVLARCPGSAGQEFRRGDRCDA